MAELLQFFQQAEQLAHDCAKAQVAIAPEARMSRFLQGQARQEAFHATLFHGAAKWMAPRHQKPTTPLPPLTECRAKINDAIKRKDFLETILAEQVILESLGQVTLYKLELALQTRKGPFLRLLHLLLQQEEAHHGFGERVLEYAITQGKTSYETLRTQAMPYLALSESIMTAMQNQLEGIGSNPHNFIQSHQQILPPWLQSRAEAPSVEKNISRATPLHVTNREGKHEFLHA